MRRTPRRNKQSGQSLVEYVLLLFVIVTMTSLINKFMPGALAALEAPIKSKFPRVYKYGHPKGCGNGDGDPPPCSGSPEMHPRIRQGGNNFRLFGRGA